MSCRNSFSRNYLILASNSHSRIQTCNWPVSWHPLLPHPPRLAFTQYKPCKRASNCSFFATLSCIPILSELFFWFCWCWAWWWWWPDCPGLRPWLGSIMAWWSPPHCPELRSRAPSAPAPGAHQSATETRDEWRSFSESHRGPYYGDTFLYLYCCHVSEIQPKSPMMASFSGWLCVGAQCAA